LGGGVSNTVLLVETTGRRFVLKQSLGKLSVKADWFSDRRRIFRESAALTWAGRHLPPGSVPEVLFEDQENWLFAMTAAPVAAQDWKSLLMLGEVEQTVAATIGRLLGAMVRASWRDRESERVFGDQTVFDQLRIDPYYRATASRHPELKPYFDRLISDSGARRVSLVHGDWSPKNFLINARDVMAIDFEVTHFGDPSFDPAFLLNHLLLKCFHSPQWMERYVLAALVFWESFRIGLPPECTWMEQAMLQHLGCLLLARVDGKSPAEYLTDRALQDRVICFARALIIDPPASVVEVFANMRSAAT
jgi:5-methylthioribose kinase